jgi:2-C-methyl-D-erythritol 4-phosphate cytidylyltransferase
MLLRALRPFAAHPAVAEIVIPIPDETLRNPPVWLREATGDRLRLVAGGATRAESVHHGVRALSEACTIILVHDAARPFVSTDTVSAVVRRAAEGAAAIAAVPISDTVKLADETGEWVQETVDRSRLWRAQTPQGFPRELLLDAYASRSNWAAEQHTDEAALVEAAGFRVALVPDSTRNIKVTTPNDLIFAEALIQ